MTAEDPQLADAEEHGGQIFWVYFRDGSILNIPSDLFCEFLVAKIRCTTDDQFEESGHYRIVRLNAKDRKNRGILIPEESRRSQWVAAIGQFTGDTE